MALLLSLFFCALIYSLQYKACSTPEFLAKEVDHFPKSYRTTTTQHSSFNGAKTNRRPNPSTGKFLEGARVVIPYIKDLHEQYRCTLAKYKVRVFFKGTNTIKSLLMHPKDPIPDAQKTDIVYHWKCPAHNCSRSLKERVSDHSAIRNHHISRKHPKAELKDFTIIDRERATPYTTEQRSTSHLYQRSITEQKHWHSQNPFSIQQISQTLHTTRTTT